VGIENPKTLAQLLAKAEPYIQYEEQEMADALRHSRTEDTQPRQESNIPPREAGQREGGRRRGDKPRGPPSLFSIYTPINASRKHILTECYNSEFKEGVLKFPKQAPAKPDQDKTKWCMYHRAHGHVTEECIHLKDAIEALIHQGKLDRFIREESPRQKTRQAANVKDQISASGGQEPKKVALCISRPEDLRVPKHIEDTNSQSHLL
jgi:hypothetical protein